MQVAVETHDFPAFAASLVPAATILERTHSGVLDDMRARQIESHPLKIQDRPALDFSYEVPGEPPHVERALAVLVHSRIYLVTAMTDDSPGDHPVVRRFLESFHFWE